jgi:hypothetical protein
MPADYSLDRIRRVVLSRAWDALSEQDLVEHVRLMHDLFADGSLDATWSQIADFSEVTTVGEISSAGVRSLAAQNPWPKTARRVLIAPVTVVFGLSRMYQLLTGAEDEHLTVVRTEEEALSFLGLRDAAP